MSAGAAADRGRPSFEEIVAGPPPKALHGAPWTTIQTYLMMIEAAERFTGTSPSADYRRRRFAVAAASFFAAVEAGDWETIRRRYETGDCRLWWRAPVSLRTPDGATGKGGGRHAHTE